MCTPHRETSPRADGGRRPPRAQDEALSPRASAAAASGTRSEVVATDGQYIGPLIARPAAPRIKPAVSVSCATLAVTVLHADRPATAVKVAQQGGSIGSARPSS